MKADEIEHGREKELKEFYRCVLEGDLTQKETGKQSWQHVNKFCSGCSHVCAAIEAKDGHRARLNEKEV